MKKTIGLVLILTLCLLSASALAGGTVTATGGGTVTLAPDMASFCAGITTQDALVTTAQAANAAAMQAVLDTFMSLGISEEDLRTDSYTVYPVYDYESSTPTVAGYEVSNTVTVVVRDLTRLPSLLDAALEAGANNVYSLSFQSSEETSAYEQALKAAAQDALRKAALMAQAIGREAGVTLSLTEFSNAGSVYTTRNEFALDSALETPIESGMLSVSAEVTAVVEMK